MNDEGEFRFIIGILLTRWVFLTRRPTMTLARAGGGGRVLLTAYPDPMRSRHLPGDFGVVLLARIGKRSGGSYPFETDARRQSERLGTNLRIVL